MIAAKAYVQFCVVNAVNTLTENANATPGGKARNAHYGTTNAKCQIATATVIALMENALASEDIRVDFVETSTALIQLVLATVFALKVHVFVKKAGRALTAGLWIKTLCNVYRIVQDMARSM